jgi:hypothetical protein
VIGSLRIAGYAIGIIFTSAFCNVMNVNPCSTPHNFHLNPTSLRADLLGGSWNYQYSYLYDSCFVMDKMHDFPKVIRFYPTNDSLNITETSLLNQRPRDRFRNTGATITEFNGRTSETFPSSIAPSFDSTMHIHVDHIVLENEYSTKEYSYWITGLRNDTMLLVTGRIYKGMNIQQASGVIHLFVRGK